MELQDPTDTTTISYWLNWRVFLCAAFVFLPIIAALLIIWKREGYRHLTPGKGENQQDGNQRLCSGEAWKPCLEEFHPIGLLVFRVIAFSLLLATLVAKLLSNGRGMFFYYTQ